MNKFTDEDLKRLKSCISPVVGLQIGLQEYFSGNYDPDVEEYREHSHKFDMQALLARLEAAEACIHRAIRDHGDLVVTIQFKSWEKAAGK